MKRHNYLATRERWVKENKAWKANAFINGLRFVSGIWQGRTPNSPLGPTTKRGLRRKARHGAH